MTERVAAVSIKVPSKTVLLPRTTDPSTRKSPEDLANPMAGEAAESCSPAAHIKIANFNISIKPCWKRS